MGEEKSKPVRKVYGQGYAPPAHKQEEVADTHDFTCTKLRPASAARRAQGGPGGKPAPLRSLSRGELVSTGRWDQHASFPPAPVKGGGTKYMGSDITGNPERLTFYF